MFTMSLQDLLLPLLLAQQGDTSATKNTAKPPREPASLIAMLSEENPKKRKKSVRKLIKSKKLRLEDWESVIARLAFPPLPLRNTSPGRRQSRRVPLWTGKKGVIATQIVLFLPQDFDTAKKYPLLIANHGTGGNASAEVGQWLRIAAKVPMIVVGATEQFENDGYRFSEQERTTQLSLLRWARLHLPVDADLVFLSGTSRGGHIVWDLGTRYPDLWAGLVSCIGGPRITIRHGQNNIRLLDNLLATPLRDLQGLKDDPGMIWNLRYAFNRLKKAKARDAQFITFPNSGHSYDLSAVDFVKFFREKRRDVKSMQINHTAIRLSEGRRSWIRIQRFDKTVKDEFTPRVRQDDWNRLDMDGKKRYIIRAADKKTANVQATASNGPEGLYIAIKQRGVKKVRLLLPRWLWPHGKKSKLRISFRGRERKVQPRASVEIWLLDVANRLDPVSAPVGIVDL